MFRISKGFTAFLTACALLLSSMAFAGGEMSFDGVVNASHTVSVNAPIGGEAGEIGWIAGQRIKVGDSILTLVPETVTATESGTVRGVFADAGDSVDACVNRYGAVLYVETDRTYTISASTDKAYDLDENKFIHAGETVYITSTTNTKKTGTGVVTAVDGSGYTVEVTEGEFEIGDTAFIYRQENRAAKSRIGRGTIARVNPTAYSGSGSVYRMLVKEGQHVEAGEALFETLSGVYDGYFSTGSGIVSDVSGIIESVNVKEGDMIEKGAGVISVYPDGCMYIEFSIHEIDLAGIHEGDPVEIEFLWNEGEEGLVPGTITFISLISSSAEGEASYTARASFEADESVRLGMTAVVYTVEEEAEDETGEDKGEEEKTEVKEMPEDGMPSDDGTAPEGKGRGGRPGAEE